MRSWKSEHRFNLDLAIKISLLTLFSLVTFSLLIYENYLHAR